MRREMLTVKGFARVQVVDAITKKIVGDSGWQRNVVVNLGFQDYICAAIGAVAGSKQVSYMAIGTGTKPGATDTSLNGETGTRVTTSNSVVSSKTLQATCQFLGSQMGGTCTIQNVALVNSVSGGTILCATTYATSQWASNQNVLLLSRILVFIAKIRIFIQWRWHQLSVTIASKLREFGEQLKSMIESIPNRARKVLEGVTTMHEALVFAR